MPKNRLIHEQAQNIYECIEQMLLHWFNWEFLVATNQM